MNRLMKFSLLAAATILLATTPSLAQTRDDPDRPQIERPQRDRGDDRTHKPKPRLPEPATTVGCLVESDGQLLATVVNDTGEVIPMGSKVVFTVQPGNAKMTILLNQDWKPGQSFSAIVPKSAGVELPAECTAKIVFPPERADGPLVFEEAGPLDIDAETLKNMPKNWEMSFQCYTFPGASGGAVLIFKNDGDYTIPKGSVLHYQLPPTMIWTYYVLTEDLPPWGQFKIEGTYLFSAKGTDCKGMTVYIPPKAD